MVHAFLAGRREYVVNKHKKLYMMDVFQSIRNLECFPPPPTCFPAYAPAFCDSINNKYLFISEK